MRALRPMVLLASIVSVVALVGCSAAAAPGSSSGDPVGTWGTAGDRSVHLVLEADGRLGGNDGCNGFGGSWSQADAEAPVEFHDVVISLMYCDGVDQWLNAGRSAIVAGDTLHVLGEDGAQIGTLPRR